MDRYRQQQIMRINRCLLFVNDSSRYFLVIAVVHGILDSTGESDVNRDRFYVPRFRGVRGSKFLERSVLGRRVSHVFWFRNDTTQVCKCARLIDTGRRAQTQTRYERYTRNTRISQWSSYARHESRAINLSISRHSFALPICRVEGCRPPWKIATRSDSVDLAVSIYSSAREKDLQILFDLPFPSFLEFSEARSSREIR